MAGGALRRYVCVEGPDGDVVQFGPGDEVPDWAIEKITNPNAWETPPTTGRAASGRGKATGKRSPRASAKTSAPASAGTSDAVADTVTGDNPDADGGDDDDTAGAGEGTDDAGDAQ